jgi:hypothetical protein
MLHELRGSTGAVGTILGVGYGRTEGHVVVMPLARPRDVPVQLVFALIQMEARNRQIITPHELLNRSSGLWGQKVMGHAPGDATPLGAPGLCLSAGHTQPQEGNEQSCAADPADRCTHGWLLE